jgi:hypothetical protein
MTDVKEMTWDDWIEEDLVVLMSLLENVRALVRKEP